MADEVVVDLETLGKNNRAVITAIGAVKFNRETGQIGPQFYSLVDPESCIRVGMRMDVSTVMWWMRQSDEARAALKPEEVNKPMLPDVLDNLLGWYNGDLPTWGNGATFDNVILRNAYELCGFEAPWSFWNDRCYRTLKNEYPHVKMTREGVHHNALDDAISQARHLIAIFAAKTNSLQGAAT